MSNIDESKIVAENSVWVYWREGKKIFRGRRKKRIFKTVGFLQSNSKIKVEKVKEIEERLFNRMLKDRQMNGLKTNLGKQV